MSETSIKVYIFLKALKFSENFSTVLHKMNKENIYATLATDDSEEEIEGNVLNNEEFTIENELIWKDKPVVKIGTINIEGPTNIVAEALATMGKKCIDFIDSNHCFEESYRIELVPMEHPKWVYQLQLKPTAWFDALYYQETLEDQTDILDRAWRYVQSIRKGYKLIPNFKSRKSPVLSRLYCNHHADCAERELFAGKSLLSYYMTDINDNLITESWKAHNKKFNIPKVYCASKNVPQLSHTSRNCNWFVEDERIVEEKGDWIIISRQEHMRELLICPHPGKNHNNHKTNKELVVSKEFWAWTLDEAVNVFLKGFCKNPYPVEGFMLNFGKWESAEAKDPNAIECHGHLHLQLTHNVVVSMENKYDAIKGKIHDPTNYGFKNCMELESERLAGLELINIRKGLKDLENGQKDLEKGQKELEKGINEIMKMLKAKNF